MRPHASAAPLDTAVLDVHLPDWDYADAFDVVVDGVGPHSALEAARCLWGPDPGLLLRARDLLVGPVGLRPSGTGGDHLFPVLLDTPQLAVLGFDDHHLDFRVLVGLGSRRVRCVTVVRRHNGLGGAYFAVVGPFHRRLVPYLLTRAARRGWTAAAVGQGAGRSPVRVVGEVDS